jgi:Protein of unknown function (DUF3892)
VATYIVKRVQKEFSADGTHRHIEGVFTDTDEHFTRKEVVDSIWAGNVWKTQAEGYEAVIEPIPYCPQAICLAAPYLKTNLESSEKDNLENLESD